MQRQYAVALLGWSIVVVALGGCAQSCEVGNGTVETGACEPTWIRDETGGVLVLRGVNLSSEAKWSADRLPPRGGQDFARLRDDLGVDALRLLVFWEAIEPMPGVYDDAYLDAVRALVDEAGRAGLRVVVDMHQDVWGTGFGFAGMPRWACDESLYASFRAPQPWFMGYFEPEVAQCFDRLYAEGPTRAAFVAAWARLARTLAGAGAVLAYEVINEPFWGSTDADTFERRIARGFYADVVDAIREEDPVPYVAIEPTSTVNVGVRTSLVPPRRDRLIYAPHYYPANVEISGAYDGNAEALQMQARGLCADATRLERPAFVGEIGVRRDVSGAAEYVADAYDALDAARLGAFAWDASRSDRRGYGLFDRDGEWTDVAQAMARPHPSRVAGPPSEWTWDRTSRTFQLVWTEDGTADGPTVISVPRLVYPNGAAARVDDGGDFELAGAWLHVPQLPSGGRRRLVLKPAP